LKAVRTPDITLVCAKELRENAKHITMMLRLRMGMGFGSLIRPITEGMV
jgi:hypothetical protein